MAVTYKYGSYVGLKTSGKITQRAWISWEETANTNTTRTIRIYSGIYQWNDNWSEVNIYGALTGQSSASKLNFTKTNASTESAKRTILHGPVSFSYTKGHSSVSKTITATSTLTNASSDAGGSSVNGKKSSVSLIFTIPAKKHITISFNANGGSGAPASQTKWYSEALTLSSTKPTRTNYTFKGWGTSSSATSATYAAGGKIAATTYDSTTSNVTLYAVWEKNYIEPTLTATNKTVFRTASSSSSTESDVGTYLYVNFSYTCGHFAGESSYTSTSCSIKIDNNSLATPSVSGSSSFTGNYLISGYETSSSHSVAITLTGTHNKKYGTSGSDVSGASATSTITKTVVLPSVKYPFELESDGSELALGMPTRIKDSLLLDIDEGTSSGYDADIRNAITSLAWTDVYDS